MPHFIRISNFQTWSRSSKILLFVIPALLLAAFFLYPSPAVSVRGNWTTSVVNDCPGIGFENTICAEWLTADLPGQDVEPEVNQSGIYCCLDTNLEGSYVYTACETFREHTH